MTQKAATKLTSEDWRAVDDRLAKSQVLSALVLYRSVTGCEIDDAKAAIGDRFRLTFPDLWRSYREVSDDD